MATAGFRRPPVAAPIRLSAIVLGAIALGFVLHVAGFDGRQCVAGGAIAFAMAGWATGAIPEITTGLAFLAVATLGHVAAPAVIFSGFAASAFWLVLSGMVVAQAMTRSGLGRRIAASIAAPLSRSYARLIIGTLAITYALAFIMPSNLGRIALLMPIMLAISDRVGLAEGRAGRSGVVLAVGFGTFVLSTTVLPANVPNLVMAGAIETTYGLRLSYIDYLLLHAPILGLAKMALLAGLICRLFPDRVSPGIILSDDAAETPMSAAEYRLAMILVGTLGCWLTEGWHGIAPAWIGLAAAVVCLAPGIAVIGPETFNDVNHRTVFYVAALLGVVAVMADSGLGTAFSRLALEILPIRHGADAWNFALLILLSFAISLIASANAVGAIYTALAGELVTATGLPIMSVLMIQVLGFSTVMFAYQAPPIAVAVGLGNIRGSQATRLGLWLTILTMLLLLPLDYVWWRILKAI